MKIVQINNFFRYGSTGKIVGDIHKYLYDKGHESYVLYGIGKKSNDINVIRVTAPLVRRAQSLISRITGLAYAGAPIGTFNTLKYLDKIKPDIVHLHCINGNFINIYRLLNYLKKKKIPTVITLHAEFLYTSGCGYSMDCEKWKTGCFNCESIGDQRPNAWFFDRTRSEWNMMKNAYSGFNALTVCAVSEWLRSRAILSPFYKSIKVETVFNGLDTQVFRNKDTQELRKKLKIGSKRVILHVTPDFTSSIKGGSHVVEMASRMANDDYVFIVVGVKNPKIDVPDNMMLISPTSNQNELAEYYSLADVCLLTSKKETFSMICAESLCCGTPIVGFKAGAPETISIKEYSMFVEQGDDNALEFALRTMLSKKYSKIKISCEAKEKYDKSCMCDRYMQIYQDTINLNRL